MEVCTLNIRSFPAIGLGGILADYVDFFSRMYKLHDV